MKLITVKYIHYMYNTSIIPNLPTSILIKIVDKHKNVNNETSNSLFKWKLVNVKFKVQIIC